MLMVKPIIHIKQNLISASSPLLQQALMLGPSANNCLPNMTVYGRTEHATCWGSSCDRTCKHMHTSPHSQKTRVTVAGLFRTNLKNAHDRSDTEPTESQILTANRAFLHQLHEHVRSSCRSGVLVHLYRSQQQSTSLDIPRIHQAHTTVRITDNILRDLSMLIMQQLHYDLDIESGVVKYLRPSMYVYKK